MERSSPPIGTIPSITVTIIHVIVYNQTWCGPWRFQKLWLQVDLCGPRPRKKIEKQKRKEKKGTIERTNLDAQLVFG